MTTNKTLSTPEQAIAAIAGTGGIKANIATRLGVSRWTFDNYLKKWASVRLAYDEECERVTDRAETVLIQAINEGDVDSAKWYLKHKGKARGYTERVEMTGENGGPVRHITTIEVHHQQPTGDG